LERGARRFGVRHAFDLIDQDGYGHHWYTSVFLQFGITRRGFEQNASYWLRNQNLSRTIRLLLDRDGAATGSGRSLYSSDFDQLWTTLLLGARKNLKGASLSAALGGSYWLPPEDCDDIASFLEGMDWSALGDEHTDEYLNEDDSFVDPFIGSTRWMLFPHGPGVVIELGGLAALELEAPYYDIVIDGRRAARLLNNDDSLRLLSLPNHSIPDAPLAFRMPDPLRPVMRASLLDPTGSTRAAQDVRLWINDEAVSVRQLTTGSSGAPLGSQNLIIADACLVVVPDDVELFPLDDNRFFGIVQHSTDSKHLALKLGQDTVWSSDDSLPEGTGPHRSPITASLVSVTEGTRGSKYLRIALAASDKLDVSSVWCGSTELSLTPRSSNTMEVKVFVAAACHEVDLLVVGRAAAGRLVTKRLRIEVPIDGFFRIRNGELERCPPTRPVTRASVAEGRYIFLPKKPYDDDDWSRTEWTLYEGPRPLGRMPLRGQPRLAPSGLGWPLTARYRPVNSEGDTQLCESVVDFGDLRATHDLSLSDDGIISLGLQDSLVGQLDEYSLIIWDSTGHIVSGSLLEVADSARGYTDVRGLASSEVEYPVAIGLCYRGFRAGAVWRKSWHKHIRELAAFGPERAARILRWLQLPVATPHASTAIRHEILQPTPNALIRGLTSQGSVTTVDGSTSLLLGDAGTQQPGAMDTPWFYALRDVIGDWLPSQETAESFVDECVDGLPHHALMPTPLIVALSTLVRINPRLAIGTARRYADACGGGAMRKRILEEFSFHVAEATSTHEQSDNEELLREQAADTLGTILRQQIDPMFVNSLVDRATEPEGWMGGAWAREDVGRRSRRCDSELLCHFPDGRRLLTIRGALLAGEH